MLITQEQYNSLSFVGREIHEYWMKWKPEMYKEMYKAGTLWQILSEEDERLFEMGADMVSGPARLSPDQAMEIIREEYQGQS